MSLGIPEASNDESDDGDTDVGKLKIENDRLKNTLFILNQKCKV